jgi:hypothetical protein
MGIILKILLKKEDSFLEEKVGDSSFLPGLALLFYVF